MTGICMTQRDDPDVRLLIELVERRTNLQRDVAELDRRIETEKNRVQNRLKEYVDPAPHPSE